MSKKVSIKGDMGADNVIGILEDLLKSFKKGRIVIRDSGEYVVLSPADTISLELEAASKKGKEKLVLELGWKQEAEILAEPDGFSVGVETPKTVRVRESGEGPCCAGSGGPGVAATTSKPAADAAAANRFATEKEESKTKEPAGK